MKSCALFLLICMAFVSCAKKEKEQSEGKPTFSSVSDEIDYLIELPEAELQEYDIAYLNLLCAKGLNGSEGLNIPAMLKNLKKISANVGWQTQRYLDHFYREPFVYDNSIGQYQAITMVTVAVQDYGIIYNPERMEAPGTGTKLMSEDEFYRDSRDAFIHGLLDPRHRMGTCASLPVFWTALGRSLDYPVFLSATYLHFFCRWQSTADYFNFEGSQNGCNIFADTHYLTFPRSITHQEVQYYHFLQPFSRKREFAQFLHTRAICLVANGRIDEARIAYEQAYHCFPDNLIKDALTQFRNKHP